MRVVLDESVFQAGAAVDLLALLLACRAPSPHFVVDPKSQLSSWGNQWAPSLRREIQSLLLGSAVSAMRPNAQTIVVHGGRSSWEATDGKGPRLSLSDALAMVRAPLRVLVENRRNDGRFIARLSVVMNAAQREFFDDALVRGWVEFEQGGGLEEIVKVLEDLQSSSDPVLAPIDLLEVRRWRLMVVVDHDALRTTTHGKDSNAATPLDVDRPSESSSLALQRGDEVLHRCSGSSAAHQLQRRALENYLPMKALQAWIDTAQNGSEKNQRRQLVDAFRALDTTARRCFNMKDGLVKELQKPHRANFDASNDSHVHERFRTLSTAQRVALRDGFGGRIGDVLFDRELTRDEWLRDELNPRTANATAPCEARDIVENIINRV